MSMDASVFMSCASKLPLVEATIPEPDKRTVMLLGLLVLGRYQKLKVYWRLDDKPGEIVCHIAELLVVPGTDVTSFRLLFPVCATPVTIAEDDDHAIALASSTGYGLAAAVQTGSVDRGYRIARKLKAGMVHVNDQTIADHPGIPMGGMGQSGNGARFGSTTNLDEFTEWQWLTLGARPVRYPF